MVLIGINRRMARLNVSFSAVTLFQYTFMFKGMDINLIKVVFVFVFLSSDYLIHLLCYQQKFEHCLFLTQ